jgi:hypothetical protein
LFLYDVRGEVLREDAAVDEPREREELIGLEGDDPIAWGCIENAFAELSGDLDVHSQVTNHEMRSSHFLLCIR